MRGGEQGVARVVAEEGESLDSLMRRFNKKVQNERILSEIRRRRFYEPPTILRKRRKAAKLRKSRRTTIRSIQRYG